MGLLLSGMGITSVILNDLWLKSSPFAADLKLTHLFLILGSLLGILAKYLREASTLGNASKLPKVFIAITQLYPVHTHLLELFY